MPLVPTLTAPQPHGSATSATTASLSWNSINGADGYRVFYFNGTQAVLIGTFAATTTSINITGLPRNSTSYFYVEAFTATQRVDSP